MGHLPSRKERRILLKGFEASKVIPISRVEKEIELLSSKEEQTMQQVEHFVQQLKHKVMKHERKQRQNEMKKNEHHRFGSRLVKGDDGCSLTEAFSSFCFFLSKFSQISFINLLNISTLTMRPPTLSELYLILSLSRRSPLSPLPLLSLCTPSLINHTFSISLLPSLTFLIHFSFSLALLLFTSPLPLTTSIALPPFSLLTLSPYSPFFSSTSSFL
ncbi:unnamed protein product [Acanthosepion pharaonis]|uniref:Uncharacterized protein n=1 Tax=Acanthosepion pharaonis TaxID=158019 RepID=A0A812CRQ4_ACAPH|nr:unnamed protein product [Sepia pharaonis]